ncbi:unnamed protein product [Timema podura]|uniref:Glucose-methanol-choline oxidoreductase N-terminal domain-containing protein n=1 Tax=Timema podura TaxID=61482 RepID=A0ABN7NPE4_TIMPD|nr:unnamed protein product [Timema podura]
MEVFHDVPKRLNPVKNNYYRSSTKSSPNRHRVLPPVQALFGVHPVAACTESCSCFADSITLEVGLRLFRQDIPNSEQRLVAGAFFFLRQGEMRPLSEITAMAPTLEGGPMDWQYKTEPQSGFCEVMKDSRCIWPRSRVLGGTSTINGMLYVRGNRRDYDNWALAGSIGWSYD